MTNEDMVELALRCEAAGGASYALECEIWDAIYPGERDGRFRTLCDRGAYKGRLGPADKDGYIQPLRAFTASLDAAMTLVPEGWAISFGEKPGLPPDRRMFAWFNDHNTPDGIAVRHVEASARTIALALTAACLRARASQVKP